MINKIILDLCGGTGSWSKIYNENGYEVWNITLPKWDVKKITFYDEYIVFQDPNIKRHQLLLEKDEIYGILATPPCTMFSFARTNAKKPRDLRGGMDIVIACLKIIWECQYRIEKDAQHKPPLKFWCLENPNGMLKWFLGKPVLEFNPNDFGDNYQKATCLWGYFNIPVRYKILMDKKQKKLAYTNSQKLPKFENIPLKDLPGDSSLKRQARRAITPSGFANAFYEVNK